MVKKIAVASGKGGTGKSTCSIGLALALSDFGKRVLLIDMDEGMRCLDMLLGVSENLLFDVSDAVGGREVASCALSVPDHPLVSLLAAPNEKKLFSEADFGRFIGELDSEEFDAVIIDLPAGSSPELYKALPTDTELVCVCNPNAVSVRDAQSIGTALSRMGKRGKLLINRFEPYYIKNPVFKSLDDIIDRSGLSLIGIVPESEKLALSYLNGSFKCKGRAHRAFNRIVRRLYDKNVPLPSLKRI